MADKKWGTVIANSALVLDTTELTQMYADPSPNVLLETLDRGVGGNLPPGYGSLVHGYGDGAVEINLTSGYWPGIASGFLTINDATAGHEFTTTGGVLGLDDGAAKAEASILNPGNVLMVNE